MGVDIATYRVRIGSFRNCCRKKIADAERPYAESRLLCVLCPKPSLALLICLTLLLLCAGDIEANPGPRVDDVYALLKECIETNKKNFDAITATLNEIQRDVADIRSRVCAVEQKLPIVPEIGTGVKAVNDTLEEFKMTLSRTNGDLEGVVDDLNNRSRRNNLLIKGLVEEEKEDYEASEKLVRDFCSSKLKINLQPGDIERAHRIGQPRPDFTRPLIIKFLNFKTKDSLLRNAHKLKNTEPKVWLEEDFSPKIQFARKMLRDFAKQNKEKDERYSIRYNKLKLKGHIYHYDAVSARVVQADPPKIPITD